jgi:hypothetical protein
MMRIFFEKFVSANRWTERLTWRFAAAHAAGHDTLMGVGNGTTAGRA